MGNMKRVALLCLTLTACTKADPTGTLTPQANKWSKNPAVIFDTAPAGDTPPMRLPSGDYAVTVLPPSGRSTDCRYSMTLTPYGKADGRDVMRDMQAGIFQRIRLNAVQGGLYTLTVQYAETTCAPDVMVEHLT